MLKFSSGVAISLKVGIYNIMGTKVADLIKKSYKPGIYTEKLDLRDIEPGVYILEFDDGVTKSHEKITITK
jgi:hypothetical protein